MIETEQTVIIHEDIENVWTFARDIRGWASLMPGMQACDVIDDDNSRWTLKVGVGGMVRTVRVQVHVDEWSGPRQVSFTYKLEGDPVQGSGTYHATAIGPRETEVRLLVQVKGSGPMAPMWEAMGRPLLPQLAKSFAGQLRDRIEEGAGARGTDAQPGGAQPGGAQESVTRASERPAGTRNIIAWLRTIWFGILGRGRRT